MKCPDCGSENITMTPITTTTSVSKQKGFGWCRAILGLIIAWPLALCGFCGMGKGKTKTTHQTKVVKVCQNCGKQF